MLKNVAVVLAVLFAECIPGVFLIGWNYDGSNSSDLGPSYWKNNYPTCAGTNQSPISIVSATTTRTAGGLTFTGYDTAPASQFTLYNNGHTAQVKINGKTSSVTSSRLNGTFVLEQLHFHWGIDNGGSEHSLDGNLHPLEIHLVHYNSDKYDNVSRAAVANDSSALLVLGIFVKVRNTSTSATLMSLADSLDQVLYEDNSTTITPFALNGLLPTLNKCQRIYTYSGSLTTPPCSQVVNWNVFAEPIYITASRLDKFRELHGDDPGETLKTNARPIQPINNRVVYSYETDALGRCNGAAMVNCGQLMTFLMGLAAYVSNMLGSHYRNM